MGRCGEMWGDVERECGLLRAERVKRDGA